MPSRLTRRQKSTPILTSAPLTKRMLVSGSADLDVVALRRCGGPRCPTPSRARVFSPALGVVRMSPCTPERVHEQVVRRSGRCPPSPG